MTAYVTYQFIVLDCHPMCYSYTTPIAVNACLAANSFAAFFCGAVAEPLTSPPTAQK